MNRSDHLTLVATTSTDDGVRRNKDSERLDWLASKASCNSSYMWLPTLFCRDLPDLRAAIDAAMAWKPEECTEAIRAPAKGESQ